MNIITAILLGILIGVIVSLVISRFRFPYAGTLRVDRSIPDEPPYLFLELEKPVGYIMGRTYVILKVNLKNYNSHE